MAKLINIAGRDVGFAAPASLPVRYRNMTDRDFFKDMQTLSESTDKQEEPKKKNMFAKLKNDEKATPAEQAEMRLNDKWDTTILFNIVHAMACAADPSTTTDLIDWLDSFEEFPIFEVFTEVQPELTRSMSTTKKSVAAVGK